MRQYEFIPYVNYVPQDGTHGTRDLRADVTLHEKPKRKRKSKKRSAYKRRDMRPESD